MHHVTGRLLKVNINRTGSVSITWYCGARTISVVDVGKQCMLNIISVCIHAFITRNVRRMRNIVLSSVSVSGSTDIFPHLSRKRQDFRKKFIIIISIQPEGRFWQELEPSQATGMALAHCILGSFLGVGCHCFPLAFRRSHFRL